MKILITSNSRNPYITELTESLNAKLPVKNSVKDFWETKELFNIVHIQWPEELFGWSAPDDKQLKDLSDRIAYWKATGAKIVVTRHNVLPNKDNAEQYSALYNFIYKLADAVIHLGKFSHDEFINDKTKQNLINWLIPHHIYESYPNQVSQQQARTKLKIPQDGKVILFFGQIRNKAEKEMILSVFSRIDVKNKYLLAPGFFFSDKKGSLIEKAALKFKHRINRLFFRSWLGYRVVKHEDVQYYLNAADVTVIPRVKNLNSGVVFLTLAFKKQLIGPDNGNIGEVLRHFNFPVFAADDSSALIEVLEDVLNNEPEIIQLDSIKTAMYTLDYSVEKHAELYSKLNNAKVD